MFKEKKNKKIDEFVDEHGWGFSTHDYTELKYFLRGMDNFCSLIPRINKLNEKQKDYVLSTIIDYKKFGYDHRIVELILHHKLDLIKVIENPKKCPDLDRIYYALQPNENLYKALVIEYREMNVNESDVVLTDYSSALSTYHKEFHEMLDKQVPAVKQLLFFKPKHFEIFLAFDNLYSTKENKKRMLNYLTKKYYMMDDIRNLNSDDFHELLTFVFSKPNNIESSIDDDYIDAKLKLIPEILNRLDCSSEYKLDRIFVKNLSELPLSFLQKLSDKEVQSKRENYRFVEIVDKFLDNEVVDNAINRLESFQSEKSARMFVDFITDDFFVNSNAFRQKLLLDLFPEETIKFNIDNDFSLVIPDSSAVKDSFDMDEELEFINPKTKMKIIVKKNK